MSSTPAPALLQKSLPCFDMKNSPRYHFVLNKMKFDVWQWIYDQDGVSSDKVKSFMYPKEYKRLYAGAMCDLQDELIKYFQDELKLDHHVKSFSNEYPDCPERLGPREFMLVQVAVRKNKQIPGSLMQNYVPTHWSIGVSVKIA